MLIVFLLPRGCLYSVSLSGGDLGLSEISDCNITWP